MSVFSRIFARIVVSQENREQQPTGHRFWISSFFSWITLEMDYHICDYRESTKTYSENIYFFTFGFALLCASPLSSWGHTSLRFSFSLVGGAYVPKAIPPFYLPNMLSCPWFLRLIDPLMTLSFTLTLLVQLKARDTFDRHLRQFAYRISRGVPPRWSSAFLTRLYVS